MHVPKLFHARPEMLSYRTPVMKASLDISAVGSRNWTIDKRYHSWAARAQIIRQDTSIKLSLNHFDFREARRTGSHPSMLPSS